MVTFFDAKESDTHTGAEAEEAAAAMDVAPAFGMDAARIGADIEVVAPLVVRGGRWVLRAGNMGLAAIGEFHLGALGIAVRTADQQHLDYP